MQGLQIYRNSFLTEITEGSKHFINCLGYKYISILTDGAINPLNNTPDQNNGEENFYITQAGKDKLLINHEIFNHPIPKFLKRIQLVHQKPLSDTPDLEYGFGHYFVVLSDYKVNIPIPKENPYISFTESIPLSTTVYKWLGKGKIDAGYEIKIPYIPSNYSSFNYSLRSSATSFEINMRGYYTDINEYTLQFLSVSAGAWSNNTTHSITRYWLQLENKDTDTAKNFHIQFIWKK